MTEAEILRTVWYAFPTPCPTTEGHVHVRDVGKGPTVCVSLDQLASVVQMADALVERLMAA